MCVVLLYQGVRGFLDVCGGRRLMQVGIKRGCKVPWFKQVSGVCMVYASLHQGVC